MTAVDERALIRKIALRIVPFVMVLYFVNFVDRVNVGFAALDMNKSLHFSPAVFGWGAGIFFIGYFFFEVPSNVFLEKIGARVWLSRIMITWGIVATLMATVWNIPSFYTMRFLLGIAEAGFFPGVVYYLSTWFPNRYRGKMMAFFLLATPLSSIVGGPVSGAILAHGSLFGLAPWQALFVLEGIPAILLGVLSMFVLSDRPSTSHWLSEAERGWLANELAQEHRSHLSGLWEALRDTRVLLLSLVQVGLTIGLYGVTLWLPQILKSYGISALQVGVLSAVPYVVTIIGMLAVGLVSDRIGHRPLQVAASCILSAAGLWLAIATPSLWVAIAGLSLCSMGLMTARPPFWSLPATFLVGTGAAAGIALVNAVGNLGGFVGPYAIGALTERTGTFHAGLVAIAGTLVVDALLVLFVGTLLARRAAKPVGLADIEPAPATAR